MALVLEMNVLKTLGQTSATHAHYQRLSNKIHLEMIAPHKYSPLKTGGSSHALILTSEYTTPNELLLTHSYIVVPSILLAAPTTCVQ